MLVSTFPMMTEVKLEAGCGITNLLIRGFYFNLKKGLTDTSVTLLYLIQLHLLLLNPILLFYLHSQ